MSCCCAISIVYAWQADASRRGEDLTPAQALTIATDPSTNTADRRRAIHRLNKASRTNVRAMHKAAEQDPEVADYVGTAFKGLESEIKGR